MDIWVANSGCQILSSRFPIKLTPVHPASLRTDFNPKTGHELRIQGFDSNPIIPRPSPFVADKTRHDKNRKKPA